MQKPIPFGDPRRLIARSMQTVSQPTTQKIAAVICGGGDPMAEYMELVYACSRTQKEIVTFCGNDQIARFPYHVDHAGTLHPEKLVDWLPARSAAGCDKPDRVWSHRPCNNVTDWTRDWQGSTGLFLVKVARELGHVHVVLCGVPMSVEAGHFIRKTPWGACHGFRRGWTNRLPELMPYVRSYNGWTHSLFGFPDDAWLATDIIDAHQQHAPRAGLKA